MKRQIHVYGTIGILSLVMGLFQNCGQSVEFSSENPSGVEKISGEIVSSFEVDKNPYEEEGSREEGDGNTDAPEEGDGNTDDPEEGDNSQGPSSDQAAHYVCILEGPGESKKASFISNEIVNDLSVPDTLCTTQQACELIHDSGLLQVKEIKNKAYCNDSVGNNGADTKNQHVIRLNTAEVTAIITDMLSN